MTLFTYAAVTALLSDLKDRFGLMRLADWRGQPGIILRHDVDLDIEPAYRLSRRELEVGAVGSFFFLTTAQTYNCGAAENRRMIRQMAHDGCEIALHFDPAIYPEVEPAELGRHARAEAMLLEDICGLRVNSVSLHNPSVANSFPQLPGWLNAYDPQIFDPALYLSDSKMLFRSDPAEFFAGAVDRTYQLLIHPMHYAESEPLYPRAKLDYLYRMADALDDIFSPNTTYQERVGPRWFDFVREDAVMWRKKR